MCMFGLTHLDMFAIGMSLNLDMNEQDFEKHTIVVRY